MQILHRSLNSCCGWVGGCEKLHCHFPLQVERTCFRSPPTKTTESSRFSFRRPSPGGGGGALEYSAWRSSSTAVGVLSYCWCWWVQEREEFLLVMEYEKLFLWTLLEEFFNSLSFFFFFFRKIELLFSSITVQELKKI